MRRSAEHMQKKRGAPEKSGAPLFCNDPGRDRLSGYRDQSSAKYLMVLTIWLV